MEKTKMTKDVVPQSFTLGLAAFDAVPVVLFLLAMWLLYRMTGSVLVLLGGIVCFLTGMGKVLWKVLVVTQKQNVWPLFVQMRIGMPLGFLLVLLGLIIAYATGDQSAFTAAVLRPGPIVCLVLAVAGMAGMIVCGAKLDSADKTANWIEQGCNTFAQGALLLAMVLAYLHF